MKEDSRVDPTRNHLMGEDSSEPPGVGGVCSIFFSDQEKHVPMLQTIMLVVKIKAAKVASQLI